MPGVDFLQMSEEDAKSMGFVEVVLSEGVERRIDELLTIERAYAGMTPTADSIADERERNHLVQISDLRMIGIFSGDFTADEVNAFAAKDLEAYAKLEGTPEQCKLADVMSSLMQSDDYRAYMDAHASKAVHITMEASWYVREESRREPNPAVQQKRSLIAQAKTAIVDALSTKLSYWHKTLKDVLGNKRRPLSGGEFKELVGFLDDVPRDPLAKKHELAEVTGLLAKAHGPSGESLFRDPDVRAAYRHGLDPEVSTATTPPCSAAPKIPLTDRPRSDRPNRP